MPDEGPFTSNGALIDQPRALANEVSPSLSDKLCISAITATAAQGVRVHVAQGSAVDTRSKSIAQYHTCR
jgi:hypothetical protein